MKNFLQNKKLGFYLNLGAVAFAVIGIIAYAAAGQDSYGYVPMVNILLGLGVLSGLVFSIRDFGGIGPVVTMALMGAGVGMFLNSRFMYYAHQFYNIASDPITAAMIVTTVALIAMVVLEVASGFVRWEEKR